MLLFLASAMLRLFSTRVMQCSLNASQHAELGYCQRIGSLAFVPAGLRLSNREIWLRGNISSDGNFAMVIFGGYVGRGRGFKTRDTHCVARGIKLLDTQYNLIPLLFLENLP